MLFYLISPELHVIMKCGRFLMLKAGCILTAFAAIGMAADTSSSSVTFTKDVLPILQAKCQTCHRPGQVAPMSFLDYQSARPWAKAMKAATIARKMPPWFADPQYGP